ncbi:DUF4189 domain-containing protein [Stenotrophomonas maltophilia]|uniref:DUF4189 domain-containing protein n=1 Tax=Stenotrophomonas TaxID=40323 RepID=UPI0009B26B28|nr:MULTISPECIES: DUF4189 domain-containing protein [Stenotrophomonas]MBA0352158.1 DUF4189 domain-containing protein [Stenotrophomonas maltophilia]MBH1405027.1 DUF4189 domain-containing protein [Stenotrophomonas maltophilia]MBH1693537.1 DUF4189 domain-containing protein [Stenotrophomonas maltophilia]MBH1802590.1 DUF4189 domain-containing protein [Stenotrophomonas maltophilia]MBH1817616.1 DUF4189 domain-containing protein [Stenotrophomonas maltophilia]
MKILVSQAILASTLILGVAYQSFAEGNCPPGYYPIGGQGARGCAPIPSGAPSSTSSGGISELPANSPTGRWIKTWGAIAESRSTQDAGASTGLRSQLAAEQEALRKCSSTGAADCSVSLAYRNQCVAWVIPSGKTGRGMSALGRGATPEMALIMAHSKCKNDVSGKCAVLYENCTKPIFEEF